MIPSKKAIEAAWYKQGMLHHFEMRRCIEAAYAIDVAPLEQSFWKSNQRIAELEAENRRLKYVLKNLYKACILADNHEELSEYVDGNLLDAAKAQLEAKNG